SGNSVSDTIAADIRNGSEVTATTGNVIVDAGDERTLFSISSNVSSIATHLDGSSVDSDLKSAFSGHGVPLSNTLTVEKIATGQWRIKDVDKGVSYIVRQNGANLDVTAASTIIAESFAVAVAIAAGGAGTKVSVAIGATVAVNEINNSISGYI